MRQPDLRHLLKPAQNGDTMDTELYFLRKWAEARRQMLLSELQQMTQRRAAILKEVRLIEETFDFEHKRG